MEQQFGGHIQTIDEIYPTPPAPESPQSAAMEHLAAIRGPQGTGEGIASDADRMANSIAGVRPAYTRQDTGGTVTKYRLAGESQVAAAQAKLQANESARAKAIRAARAGDVAAQRALEERGIRWQM